MFFKFLGAMDILILKCRTNSVCAKNNIYIYIYIYSLYLNVFIAECVATTVDCDSIT